MSSDMAVEATQRNSVVAAAPAAPAQPVPPDGVPSLQVPESAVREVLAQQAAPRMVFQPIIDLRRAVTAGYEMLSRFDGPVIAPPDAWFTAADAYGLGAELEARVVRRAVAARAELPEDAFLSFNLSPHLVDSGPVLDALAEAGDLSRLVVELTEHVPVDDLSALQELLTQFRSAGAWVALDDVGTGYAGLQQLAAVRPELVKLDRTFVDHADRDAAKLALAELLGAFASRLDAVVLAEGTERQQEVEAFVRVGVPLAQGYFFGRPQSGFAVLSDRHVELVQQLGDGRRATDLVGALLQRTPVVREDDLAAAAPLFGTPGVYLAAVVDQHGRAVCLLRRPQRAGDPSGEPQVLPVSLRVAAAADLRDVATRAMTRPEHTRFDPIVCGDEFGRYLGVVLPDQLLLRLAERP